MVKAEVLSLKEKSIINNFLSWELPKYFQIKYPSQIIQNIFKLNGTNRIRKKKQKEREEKKKQKTPL